MELINHTKQPELPDYAIRRAVSWMCRELGMKTGGVTRLRLTNRSDGHTSGHCYTRNGRIHLSVAYYVQATASIPDGEQTWTSNGPWDGDDIRRRGGEHGVRHRFYLMLHTLAHEISHRYLFLQGAGKNRSGRAGGNEQHTEWHAREIMQVFNRDRTGNLDAILQPPKPRAEARLAKDPRQLRAEKDAELLRTWERKRALAQTKVTKYKARVRRAKKAGLFDGN